jgi:peptidoglycan hydrolase-like protein with peptidoglycan-binding domain
VKRRLALAVLGVLVVAGGAGAAWSQGLLPVGASAAGGETDGSSPPASTKTADIERRTLQVSQELSGTLGYDGAIQVGASLPGTLTWLPSEGTIVRRGQRLYEVDGRYDSVLLIGTRPAWRTIGPDSDAGVDIKLLERNLKAMGYGPTLKVDGIWTDHTTKAVKRWQKDIGLPADGIVDLGEVVFEPTAVRVTEQVASLGSRLGGGAPVLKGTTPNKVVSLALEADSQELVSKGAAVTVELPDGTTTPAHISTIGRVAHPGEETGIPGESSPATIDVTITLDDPRTAGSLDQAPVTIYVVTDAHENVLAVPVNALVALLEGGYAVEVQAADGSRRYVGVELGLFQDGWVEITGAGLEAGQKVVVAS